MDAIHLRALVTACLLFALSGCAGSSPDGSVSPSGSATSSGSTVAASSSTPAASAPVVAGLVVWDAPGKAVQSAKDAGALGQDAAHPVKDDFVAFLGALWQTPAFTKDCGAPAIVLLHAYHPDGWARASVNSCDGAAEVVYGMQGGTWGELLASQGVEKCDKLRRLQVPIGSVDQCTDADGKTVPYAG